MDYNEKDVWAELQEVNGLINDGLLQKMRLDRARMLAEKGLTGLACADGLYNHATADCCEQIHFIQHLLKLNGAGFLLGLDPNYFEGRQREYLKAARIALLYDLEVSFHYLKKGSTVFVLSHAPNCGQRAHFGLSLWEMLVATHRAHEVVVEKLKIQHNLVIPILMVDRDYGNGHDPEIELYVIKHDLIGKNDVSL